MQIDLNSLQSNIAKATQYGSALSAGVKMLPGMIQDAESLLPAQGTGAQKLQMVQNWIEGALGFAGHAEEVVKAVWPKLEPVIATLVTLYTHNGAFAAILNATLPAAAAPAAS